MFKALKTSNRARIAKWREGFAHGLDTKRARSAARWDMQVNDHGFLRRFWTNLDEIRPGIWRSNQPSPRQLQGLAERDIKTVINLRGASQWGSYHLERDACARLGIKLIDFRLRSRDLPTVEEIHALHAIYKSAETPLLMHCKSGADRAGMGAALYMLLIEESTPQVALEQLSFKYLHIKAAKTGLLDHMIEDYAAAHGKTGITFLDWVDGEYDRLALTASFKQSSLASFFADKILRRE